MEEIKSKTPQKPKAEKKGKNKKNKKNSLLPITVILAVCTMILLILCAAMAFFVGTGRSINDIKKMVELTSEVPSDSEIPMTFTQAEVDEMLSETYVEGQNDKEGEIKGLIREEAESKGPSFINILRKLYPECMVYPGDGTFYFEDVDTTIPKNPYLKDNFVTEESGFRYYKENDKVKSTLCIDISSHQGAVDWPKVAEAGVQAVIIRAGYRGYGSGKMVMDEQADGNINGATSNGLKTGVYFFSQAINEEEIDEEVEALLELIEPYHITGPVAIDVEKLDAETARTNSLTADERTALVIHFCEKVQEAGYTPMIYGNAYSLFHMLNYKEICKYPIWYAYYSDSLYYHYDLTMWQYSSNGKVPGVTGNVDLNVLFEEPAEG